MRRLDIIPIALLLLSSVACTNTTKSSANVEPAKLRVFGVLPVVMESSTNPLTEEKISLGRMLYYEARLSQAHDVSCNTCHLLDRYGVDQHPVSTGHSGLKGDRNAPTVYNAAGHLAQFWDGRAADVEAQAKGPVLNPVEMAMPSEKYVVGVLKSMPEYVDAFKKAFPGEKDPVSFDNMARAIGAFERRLVTPGRWDKFLQGDQAALSDAEKAGLNTFLETGCQACHNGPYLGGATFQKLGAVTPWPDSKDPGRFKVTKQEADRMMFKVPSLRNIGETGPYYHDGSIAALDAAVKSMAEYQLGRQLNDEETTAIVTWLKSLSGALPTEYIKEPELPKSTPRTPKPA